MATRARTVLVAALIAIGAVACSGGDTAVPLADPPSTSAAPASSVPSASPSSSAAAQAGLPADVRAEITVPQTGDAARAALLRDWKAGQVAYVVAAAKPDPRSPAVARYYARDALVVTLKTLRDKAQKRRTVIGTRKISDVAVAGQSATAATMTWCVDDSEFFARDLKTGKPIVSHEFDRYRARGQLLLDPELRVWVLVRSVLIEKVAQC